MCMFRCIIITFIIHTIIIIINTMFIIIIVIIAIIISACGRLLRTDPQDPQAAPHMRLPWTFPKG